LSSVKKDFIFFLGGFETNGTSMKKFVISSFIATFGLLIFYLSVQKNTSGKVFTFKNPIIGEFEIVSSDNYQAQDLVVLTTVPKGTKFRVVHTFPAHGQDSDFPYKVFIRIDIPELKNRVIDASALFKNYGSLIAVNLLG
jgi:hypothetical protein